MGEEIYDLAKGDDDRRGQGAVKMSTQKSKSMRLRFKGEATERKKKSSSTSHKHKHREKTSASSRGEGFDSAPPDDNEQAWVAVERPTDLAGPSFFYQASQASTSRDVVCIALNTAQGQIEPQVVDANEANFVTIEDVQRAALDVDGATVVTGHGITAPGTATTPADVTQVWVATRVLDTPSSAPRYTLRSSEAKFMTAEPHGGVSAFSEARGPLEEWTVVEASSAQGGATFALRGANGNALGLDTVAGGRRVLRCDVPLAVGQASALERKPRGGANSTLSDVDPLACWHVKVQWKYRHEARRKELSVAPLRTQRLAA